jgi:hypothetical protein
VVAIPTTTVVDDSRTTVVDEPATTVVGGSLPTTVEMWRAESNGQLFPLSRIHRIKRAQDALTHIEESVYDFLWGPKNTDKDPYRLTRAGYDRIGKEARITKRNAALVVDRLIEKGFVQVESPADPLRRLGCQYRVHCYKAVLESFARRAREWVVKSGNGVLFVHPIAIPSASPTTTVVAGTATTVDAGLSTTVVVDESTTVDAGNATTVVAATTHLDNKRDMEERQSSSSGFSTIHEVARKWSVVLDDDAVRKLIRRCRDEDPAATEDEIAAFLNVKILQLRNSPTRNMVGMLLSAVPAYFAKPATELALYRRQKAEERAKHLQIAHGILEDPESSPQDRQWAQDLISNSAGKG